MSSSKPKHHLAGHAVHRNRGPRPSSLDLNGGLADIVDALCAPCDVDGSTILRGPGLRALPSRDEIIAVVENLRSVLFPGYFGLSEVNVGSQRFHVGSTLDTCLRTLHEQVLRALCFVCNGEAVDHCLECEDRSLALTRAFLTRLPAVRQLLISDVHAAYEGDPAATSADECVLSYPGTLAITSYRLAHELHLLGVPIIPRIITEHAHSITGIDIHPGARIGERFFIDHGTGIVIGETAVIGRNVRLYQGVTLGAKSFPLDEHGHPVKGVRRHPTVEDDVIIYAGSTILGTVVIGKGSIIGGNVWLTRSVPPHSRISQAHTRIESFANGGGI
ncbi:MAG: serine acetyltransferase [Myxococcota bacterium]|jgi:serine O-acetyltransferase|nr:serine acetyltransferase [Myxococcota bacterium]